MKKAFNIMAITFLCTAATHADKPEQIWKIGYSTVDSSAGGINFDSDGFSITGEFALDSDSSGRLFGFARYSQLENKENFALGVPIDFDIDSFAVGVKYNFNESIEMENNTNFYGRLGFERSSGDARVGGIFPAFVSDSDTGLTYGIGVEHHFDNFGVFVEWADHDNDVIDESSMNFGVSFKF